MDFSKLEQAIDRKLRSLSRGKEEAQAQPEFLELHRAILEEIARRVQPIGRGQKAFPFQRLLITVPVLDAERLPYYQQAFCEGETLLREVRDRIREEGTEPPRGLTIDVQLPTESVARAEGKGFFIEFLNEPATLVNPAALAPTLRLRVSRGNASPAEITLRTGRTNLGRLAEVLNQDGRVVRRNDVVFNDEADETHTTVSREHAHIVCDAATGECRLFDDHSAHGTWVLRQGVSITVPSGSKRGERLLPEDELFLGKAGLRVESA